MGNFAYYIISLILTINQIESNLATDCNTSKEPLRISKSLNNRLKNHYYVTKGMIGHPKVHFPTPNGTEFGLTYYYLHYSSNDAEIFTFWNDPIPTRIWRWIHYFKLDKTKYIFHSTGILSENAIDISNVNHPPARKGSGNFSFALIYESPDEDLYIYQTCDRSYAWLQIECETFRRRRQYLPPYYDNLNEYMDTIRELLPTLGLKFEDFRNISGISLHFHPDPYDKAFDLPHF